MGATGDLVGNFRILGVSQKILARPDFDFFDSIGQKRKSNAFRTEKPLPSATACFMDDFEACIAHLRLPVTHRRAIRTTNLLERLFVEERRRLKIIPNPFGEKPVLKLMFGAMTRAAERWRAIKVTDFERRQMQALRAELDHEYEAQTSLVPPAPKDARPHKLSSTSRT